MFFYFVIIFIAVYCYKSYVNYRKYYSQGLKGGWSLPIFGDIPFLFKKLFKEYEQNNFKKYGSTYVDFIMDKEGVIVTSNKEYVKKILVKDFQNFSYRYQDPYTPRYARESVIFLNGSDWKRVRAQSTPIFSTGKLKIMFKHFNRPIQNCLDNIKEEIDAKKGNKVNVRKLMRAYSLDIIGHVIFSLQTNAYKNDEFSKIANSLVNASTLNLLATMMLPNFLIKLLKISLINEEAVEYFAKLSKALINERKKQKDKVYNDFIELLLKSETEEDFNESIEEDSGRIVKKLSPDEIVGQCFLFFIAALETVGTALSVLLYELALHQEIQDKLYKELVECHPNDEITYEEISKSKYLDICVKEALRKHTNVNRILRIALADYDFGEFKVKKGQTIGISLVNLHNDPSIYKDPHKFIPERFEDPSLINDSTGIGYSPFLDGSRNCIGFRFATIEIKSLIIKLIKNYRIFATKQTDIPVKTHKMNVFSIMMDLNLGFENRLD